MTPAVTEEAQRLLRIAKADLTACIALIGAPGQLAETGDIVPVSGDQLSLINPYAVTLRYDDIDIELISPQELRDVVETVIEWAERMTVVICADSDGEPGGE